MNEPCFPYSLDNNVGEKVSEKEYLEKSRYFSLIFNRYNKMMLSIIKYRYMTDRTSIKIEYFLRRYGSCWLTMIDKKLLVTQKQVSDTVNLRENFEDGNCIQILNKTDTFIYKQFFGEGYYQSDYDMLLYYCEILTRIERTRQALIRSAKFNTFIIDDYADENTDVLDLITALENDSPYIQVSEYMGIKDAIVNLNGTQNLSGLAQLKDEFNTRLAELNEWLGIKTLAVDKASGVTVEETRSNSAYTNVNQNIYLSARNEALEIFNRKFATRFKAEYRHELLETQSEVEKNEIDNNVL